MMGQHPNWHLMMELKNQEIKNRARSIAEYIQAKQDTRANIAEYFDLNDQTVTRILKTFIDLGFCEKVWDGKVITYKMIKGAKITDELIEAHLDATKAFNRIHYEIQSGKRGVKTKDKEEAFNKNFSFVKYESTGVQVKQVNAHTRLISVNKHPSKYGSDEERKAARGAKTWAGIVDYGSM